MLAARFHRPAEAPERSRRDGHDRSPGQPHRDDNGDDSEPGECQPAYWSPGGGGKVPIGPEYVLAHDKQRVIIRNYEGKVFEYPELNEASTPLKSGSGVPPSPRPLGAEAALKSCCTTQEGNGHNGPSLD